jgi:RND family efflux transporter MFP subunit
MLRFTQPIPDCPKHRSKDLAWLQSRSSTIRGQGIWTLRPGSTLLSQLSKPPKSSLGSRKPTISAFNPSRTTPFTGVITMRYADVGSLIQAGTASNTQSMPVVKVAQSDLLRLRMPVPEEEVPFIKTGGAVSIKLQATGKTFTGKIIRFTRELTTSTRTMLAEVDVPNPDLTLSTGMTAQTTIVLQAQKSVLTVPAGAVLKGEGQASVLVVDTDNKVQKVPVTLGIQSPNRIEITQGLSEHQSVIVSGQTNYQPGQVVRPQLSTISMPKQGSDQ